MGTMYNNETEMLIVYLLALVFFESYLRTKWFSDCSKVIRMFECMKSKPTVKENVVLLHQLDRGAFLPSISPFPLKLETYLRINKIPYENDFKDPIGPKGKTPWITFNGEDIADSQICLERLAQHFKIDMSCHLTEEERGIARSFQIMTEEHLYWVVVLWRWVYTKGKTLWDIQPSLPGMVRCLFPIVVRKIKGQTTSQGMGRHSKKEVIEMGLKDLRAISDYLGTKSFLMGSQVTEVDCAIFGMLAQIVWNMPGSPYESHLNGELSNLTSFCERMKEQFWPDWDQCLYGASTTS